MTVSPCKETKIKNFQTYSYLWYIVDVHNDLSTGSYGTINTVQPFMTFMNKKSNKKKATKNGQEKKEDNSSNQALSNKKHRKDKGNRRVTSYMLWSRDKRQQLIATHPELDFASIAREIGKMWSNVSSNEKYNWKRRAKRLNAKIKEQQIKPTASEYVSSHPFWYNADHNSTESDHMDQWTLTEVAEAPVSNRQAIIEGDLFLKKTIRTTPRDRSKKKCCCGMDDKRTTKKKVETSTKSWGEIQRLKYCSRTRVVETVKQVKAKFESEIVVD